jgi:hypothetical protein
MEEKVEIKSNVERLEMYSDQYPFNLPLRIRTFESEADYNKFIKNCEKLIRGSIEYREWVNYIKDVLQVQTCFITNEKMDECSIEIHHHVPTMYTLVKSLINKELKDEKAFSTFDIALKAIELHFSNKIGYLSLIGSMHEKLHNGFLSVPHELIRGDYKYFLDNYSQYLDDEDLVQIHDKLSISSGNAKWTKDDYPGIQGIL